MSQNPLIYVLIFAGGAFALAIGISLVIAITVAIAGRIVGDRNEKKYHKQLRSMLPGHDCGKCGFENCDAYARAVYYGAASESACVHGDEQLRDDLIACMAKFHKDLEDPTPIKPKKDRILGIWDKPESK